MKNIRFCNVIVVALLQLFLLLCFGVAGTAQAVRITNLQNGEELRYPVALIEGEVDLPDGTVLSLSNDSSPKTNNRFMTSVLGGRFKALMELVPGDNSLFFEAAQQQQAFRLRYKPMTTPNIVRVIYVVDSGGETQYPTQFSDDPQNFRAKLQTAARLIQTFTAETMKEAGWNRKTFRLEEDQNGEVIVHVLRAPREASYYQSISEGAIGGVIRDFVNPRFPTDTARNLVVNNTAAYDPATGRTLGHCANSDNGTGVFSALSLFSWPGSLQEVQRAFSNTLPIDKTQVADDSNGRGRLWAMAATTIGVTLHELGHAFNLPHSTETFGIMSRGHDFFNRNFTLIEPPIPGRERYFPFPDSDRARFESGNVSRLAYHPFFQPDPRPQSGVAPPSIEVDFSTGDIVVNAPAGLRALSVEHEGVLRDTISYREQAPQKQVFERRGLQKIAGALDFALVAIDNEGRGLLAGTPQLLDVRSFVRSWRLSPPIAWTDTTDFPKVNAARLQELTEQTAAREPQLSLSPFIDIRASAARAGSTERKVAYAYRAIESDAEQRALLATGSDDTLRVWVNGQLVCEKGVFRMAQVDEDQFPVTLKRGHNDVLVEVANIDGGWGFYLRMVDAANLWLYLTPDGSAARLDRFFDPKNFVRAWRFALETSAWPSRDAFAPLTPQRRAQMEDELRERPLEVSRSPFVDLRSHYEGGQPVDSRVSYTQTTIRSDRERKLTLLTGGDDALRVWLNGQPVLDRLAARAAQPDDDRAEVTLGEGENTLMVEVSTGDGAWGFYLRFQDNGQAVGVTEDGTLSMEPYLHTK